MMCCFCQTKRISMISCTCLVFKLVITGTFAIENYHMVNLKDSKTNFLLQVNSSIRECREDKKAGILVDSVEMYYEVGCNPSYARANLSSSTDRRELVLHIKDKCDYQRNCSLTKSDFQLNSTCDNKCSCPYLYYIAYSCKPDDRATTQTAYLSTVTSVTRPKVHRKMNNVCKQANWPTSMKMPLDNKDADLLRLIEQQKIALICVSVFAAVLIIINAFMCFIFICRRRICNTRETNTDCNLNDYELPYNSPNRMETTQEDEHQYELTVTGPSYHADVISNYAEINK